jgi:addiction module HigA family antidote
MVSNCEKELIGRKMSLGEFLKESMADMDMSVRDMAMRMGCSTRKIRGILDGKISVSVDLAIDLDYVIGAHALKLLDIQRDYELWVSENKKVCEPQNEFTNS